MKRSLVPFLLVLAPVVLPARDSGPQPPSLGEALDAHLVEIGFSGVVLARQRGEIVIHRAYGASDRARSRPTTLDTSFFCASVAKNFTAAAVLALEEDGLLTRDDPIARHLGNVPEDRAAITVGHLLSHTSGIGQNYAADGVVDRDEAVRAILGEPLESEPGAEFHYSNDGYTLLAVLVEVVSGESFETYLRRRLFAPAGLRSTSLWGRPAEGAGPRAELDIDYPAEKARPNWGWKGATGVATTTGDLLRWWDALRAGSVLAPETVETLWRGHVALGEGSWAGYGWFRTPIPDGDEPTLWARGRDDSGENGILLWVPRLELLVIALSHAGDLGDYPAAHRAAYEAVRLAGARRPLRLPDHRPEVGRVPLGRAVQGAAGAQWPGRSEALRRASCSAR